MKMIVISLFVTLGILALGLSVADARQPRSNPGQLVGAEGFPANPDVVPASMVGKDTVDVIDLAPSEDLETKHQAIVVWGDLRVSVMLTRDTARFQKQAQEWVEKNHPGAKVFFVPSGAEMRESRPPEAGGPARITVAADGGAPS